MKIKELRKLIREELSSVSGAEISPTDFVEKLEATGWTKELNSIFKKQFKKPTLARQLEIANFTFDIKDKNGNELYYEIPNGYWCKREYDANNNEIYYETSDGFWCKREYDANNNEIYYEDSNGDIEDNRPKQTKLKELNEAVVRKLIREELSSVSGAEISPTDFVEKLKATGWTKELNSIFKKQFKKPTLAKQLGITKFPFAIKDKNGNVIYCEDYPGFWYKKEFDAKNNKIYFEESTGFWYKKEYDANNNKIYYENSKGGWYKREYDANNNEIYYENSDGDIDDNRPKQTKLKEYTHDFGAFRRIIVTSPKKDFIKTECEKEVKKNIDRGQFTELNIKYKIGIKPNTLIIDMDGKGATAMVSKLRPIIKKWDNDAVIKIHNSVVKTPIKK